MHIRYYRPGEEPLLRQLFFQTIHTVNQQHYAEEQLNVWAPPIYDENQWRERMAGVNPFVCLADDTIVGYAGVLDDGYVDHFYVHHLWQGKRVGTHLMDRIHQRADELRLVELTADVSITARPFFESKGFVVVRPQEVHRNGVMLPNFKMRKQLVA